MRAFIAIELSEKIRAGLAQIQSCLKHSEDDVKWAEKENIHLTIKFLGEISEENCSKVKAALDITAGSFKPFKLKLKDIGVFPKIGLPRVIWAGIDKGARESSEIARLMDEELSKIGFESEARPFAAHATIGRVRSPKNIEALKEKLATIGDLGFGIKEQIVDSISLFQSKLTPTGPIYTKLHEAKLG